MTTLFLLCSVIGGTLLLCQTFLTLLGMGGDHDVGGGDHDFSLGHADGGHDFDAHDGDVVGHEAAGDAGHHTERGSSAFFGVLTFRTIVAAMTFFGLAGLAGQAAGWRTFQVLIVAVGSGGLAMYAVHQTMKGMAQLRADGTVRTRDAVGCHGSVYLRIPAGAQGLGKVHVVIKHRTVELGAQSAGEELPTGQPVSVVRVLGPNLVEVAPRESTAV
jgi:hypothetical protein